MKQNLTPLMVAKVHPLTASESPCCSCSSNIEDSDTTATRSFTVWMKSLVMQANGCTVFNEDGEIVYRVDNYDKKGSKLVYLMDFQGDVLFTIHQRRLWRFRQWRGYQSDGLKAKKPVFNTRSCSGIFADDSCREVIIVGNQDSNNCFKLETSPGKSALKIKDSNGEVVAEAKRKQLSTGVLLGDDVLTLKVEPIVDQSFIVALVIVFGLMHHKL